MEMNKIGWRLVGITIPVFIVSKLVKFDPPQRHAGGGNKRPGGHHHKGKHERNNMGRSEHNNNNDGDVGSRRPMHAGQRPQQHSAIDRIAYGKALFKKKQQQKRDAQIHEKASMLRNYAKLCKREGIQSERVHIGPKDDDADGPRNRGSGNKRKQRNKDDQHKSSLQREYDVATDRKNKEAESAQQEFVDKELLKAQNEKKRKEANKLRMQKTKKGQPILGNQIKSILSKLQS
jgi:flagellar biosynthesis GTPase FlhF